MKITELSSPVRTVIVLAVMALVALPAVREFRAQATSEPIVPGPGVTRIAMLSDYHPNLEGTAGDTEVYFLEGSEPGGTTLIAPTHASMETAAYLAAIIAIEQATVERGTLIVIPRANASSFDSTEDSFAYPGTMEVATDFGTRWFRVASRLTNATSQWPDPKVYPHYPTGQSISGKQARNLNRTFPGRPNGLLTEQIAFAIMEIVRNEKVDLFIDPHEAPPSRPLVNAMAAHQRAMDVATLATMYLELEGIRQRLEASPEALRGLTHREVGDHSDAFAVLVETVNGIDGPLRGFMYDNYVATNVDALKTWASEAGRTTVPHPAEGVSIAVRTGRHIANFRALIEAMSDLYPHLAMTVHGLPLYADIVERGVGHYLLPVPPEDQRAPFGIPVGRW